MRLLLIFLSLMICFSVPALADKPAPKQEYKIMGTRPNNRAIYIKGKKKPLLTGQKISGKDKIDWDKTKAREIRAELANGTSYIFSKQAFQGKNSAQTIDEFFLNSTPTSSRGDNVVFTAGQNKELFPEKRIALVIGNSNYLYTSTLLNAQGDAMDIAETLNKLGFDVMEAYECNTSDFESAVKKFASHAADYDVALFYYSGHGLQYDKENYLVPITSTLGTTRNLANECINCTALVNTLEDCGVKQRLIYLDACRNIPRSFSRSAMKGLAPMEGNESTVIMFATQSGKLAYDGNPGENSPFAAALLGNLIKPKLDFPNTMQAIVMDTYKASEGRQTPSRTGELMSAFSFNSAGINPDSLPAPKVTPTPAPQTKPASNNKPTDKPTTVPTKQTKPSADSNNSATGVVCDETGDPLIGVLVRNANKSMPETSTDLNGHFVIKGVDPGTKLIVIADGYQRTEVVWQGSPLVVIMKSNSVVSGNNITQPKIEFVDGVDVQVESVRRVGNDVLVTMYVTNNSGKKFYLYSHIKSVNTAAYDNAGNMYKYLRFGSGGGAPSRSNLRIEPIDNIPVKVVINIPDFSRVSSNISRITMCFMDGPNSYFLNIYDLPVNYKTTITEVKKQESRVVNQCPYISVGRSEFVRSGNEVRFSLYVKNVSDRDMDAKIVCGDISSTDENSRFYREDGTWDLIAWSNVRSGGGYTRASIPSGIQVVFNIVLGNIPKNHTTIPRLILNLRGVDQDVSYGKAQINFYDIPIVNPTPKKTTTTKKSTTSGKSKKR